MPANFLSFWLLANFSKRIQVDWRNPRLSLAFPTTLLACSSRFLRALQHWEQYTVKASYARSFLTFLVHRLIFLKSVRRNCIRKVSTDNTNFRLKKLFSLKCEPCLKKISNKHKFQLIKQNLLMCNPCLSLGFRTLFWKVQLWISFLR